MYKVGESWCSVILFEHFRGFFMSCSRNDPTFWQFVSISYGMSESLIQMASFACATRPDM